MRGNIRHIQLAIRKITWMDQFGFWENFQWLHHLDRCQANGNGYSASDEGMGARGAKMLV